MTTIAITIKGVATAAIKSVCATAGSEVVDSEEGPLDGVGRGVTVVASVVRDVLGQTVVAGVKIQQVLQT